MSDRDIDRTISRGLDWLASRQSRQGHWTAPEGRYPTAITALSATALLCEGSTTMQGKYSTNIQRAVNYLVKQCQQERPDRRPATTTATPMATASPCSSFPRCWERKKTPIAARS